MESSFSGDYCFRGLLCGNCDVKGRKASPSAREGQTKTPIQARHEIVAAHTIPSDCPSSMLHFMTLRTRCVR